MQKWEYMTWSIIYTGERPDPHVQAVDGEYTDDQPVLYKALATAGADGWELVTVLGEAASNVLYFKRPKQGD